MAVATIACRQYPAVIRQTTAKNTGVAVETGNIDKAPSAPGDECNPDEYSFHNCHYGFQVYTYGACETLPFFLAATYHIQCFSYITYPSACSAARIRVTGGRGGLWQRVGSSKLIVAYVGRQT